MVRGIDGMTVYRRNCNGLDCEVVMKSDMPLDQAFYCPGCKAKEKLRSIAHLCRRYNSPAVNVATHALARKVLEIAEGKT